MTNRQAASGLAFEFQTHLATTRAIAGTSEMHLIFDDQSVFSFQVIAGNPQPRGKGGDGSWARKFYDSVKGFDLTPKGIEFLFTDGSRWALDLGGTTTTYRAH